MKSKQSFQEINETPVSEEESTSLFCDTFRVRTSLSLHRTVLKKQIYYMNLPHACGRMVSLVHKELDCQVQ